MAIVVSGISLPFAEPEAMALEQARKVLLGQAVAGAAIARKSVDARRKGDIRFVYSVALEMEVGVDEDAVAARLNRPDVAAKSAPRLEVVRGAEALASRPVVVGFGPAGMFAALLLAREGMRPLVLERGADVDTRVVQVEGFWSTGALHPDSNVQFGEGGAGTFSDGKLVTRIHDPRCGFVLDQLAAHGAPGEIRYQAKPHVGTDRLRAVVKSIREEIVGCGGEIRFDTRLTGLVVDNGRVWQVETTAGPFPAEAVVLAPGHSARDVFAMLAQTDVCLEAKPFSVGVRIEHLQAEVDRALYGDMAGHPLLPKGEYQLSHREGGQAVYTFCMCPGGVVVPAASEQGMVVTNGMSGYARDGVNANSALVVSVGGQDYGSGALDGVEFQRRLETAAFLAGGGCFAAPAQTVGRLLEDKPGLGAGNVQPTYACGLKEADFSDLLPDRIVERIRTGLTIFDRKQRGFASPDAVLTGVESRTSSPVRICRGEDLQATSIAGLYPCGEGAGYAGGIVSSAVDGVRVAQALLARYRGLQGE